MVYFAKIFVTCYTAITIFYLDLTRFDKKNNASFGVRAEILLSQVIASRLSSAGHFLGVVQKY